MDQELGQLATGMPGEIKPVKAVERNLRESERMLATLLANLPGMAYRCRNDEKWTMDFVSEGCRELTGYSPDDLLGNPEDQLRRDRPSAGSGTGARRSGGRP